VTTRAGRTTYRRSMAWATSSRMPSERGGSS
jgi:hypothetical protein